MKECQFVIFEIEFVLGRGLLRCPEVKSVKVLAFPEQAGPGRVLAAEGAPEWQLPHVHPPYSCCRPLT